MPSKSLTLKFGADTTRLDAALKKLRRGLTKSIGGTARKTVGGLATGFLGGFAGGMFAGGAAGIAQGIFGELMDISPQFAMSMMNLGETIRREAQPEMENLADAMARATPTIAQFAADMIQGAADFIDIVRGEKKPTAADTGFFTAQGAAAGLKAIGDAWKGDLSGTGEGWKFDEWLGAMAGLGGGLVGAIPGASAIGLDQGTANANVVTATDFRRRMFGDDPVPGQRHLDYQRAIYGDEGIAPGTI